jgi:hypothetical protein
VEEAGSLRRAAAPLRLSQLSLLLPPAERVMSLHHMPNHLLHVLPASLMLH